ncbi:hypothetical protein K2173_023297 [Erythroxylum novogranatense]|uniref:Uncharacterized protein n=1 Tax=Erythroxylum novogranatense TaxID=1862640 RepID=A0AAV8T8H1_9ROSI|nr:hypothetical protein K2173_023297 [Erythroxylum novogranatense]
MLRITIHQEYGSCCDLSAKHQTSLARSSSAASIQTLSYRSTYSPLVFFYPVDDSKHSKTAQLATQLKWSLSKTLDAIYPLSGRIELLNGFLPCQPFCQLNDPIVAPVTVQLNVFDCGGIALGVCLSHKLVDGTTASIFLKSWASNASGVPNNIHPNLSDAAVLFPPVDYVPQRYITNAESSWFSDCRCVTRRFGFHDKAVAALMAKGASTMVEYPTRIQAISGFIWKHATAASRSISGSSKPSVAKEVVNIRSRRLTKPRLSKHSIGNLIQFSMSHFNPQHTDMEMDSLVALLRDGVAEINNEYIKDLTGDRGSASYFDLLNRQEEILKGNPETFMLAAWITFGFNDIDFGWGKPIWVGVMGNTSRCIPSIPNLILLNNAGRRNGVEAWMILDEKIMRVLERDPEFLAYASPNPCISSLCGDF